MTNLGIFVVLLLANAFFVGAEFAVIAARRTHLEQLAADGNARAEAALDAVNELSFMLASAQLGITMASLGLGWVAEPAVAHLLEVAIGSVVTLSEGVLHAISLTLGLMIVVFLHMVVGEMVPKNIVISEPSKSALWLALPFRVYSNALRPFIHLLSAIAAVGSRLFGAEPQDERGRVATADELSALIEESAKEGMLRDLERRLLTGALEFAQRDAASVMVPRTDVNAVPSTATPAEIEETVVRSGHSRLPVYGRNLDNILGFLHAKDLLKVGATQRDKPIARKLIRDMLVAPESLKIHPLLLQMRRERRHFALVVDEHGGTAGIVTLEDILEELVGEIRDEYDESELGIERLGEGRFLVPGTLRIDEVESRLGIDLPAGEYETLAGFILDRLGRIPKRRETVLHDGWRLQVQAMRQRRIAQVLIDRASQAMEGEGAGALVDADPAERGPLGR